MNIRELAKMIDHSLLHPTMTDETIKSGCETAVRYGVASVCAKPYSVAFVKELLQGSDVATGCVVGFPHGNSSVRVKMFEAEQAIRDGAVEIDMVINIGKALAGDRDYLLNEIRSLTDLCHQNNAIIKVIFETDFVTRTDDKIMLCELCTSAGADFVKTSTGYGFVKQAVGGYDYTGATAEDVRLMRRHSGAQVQVKAAGAIRTLDDMLRMIDAGATRIGATATGAILIEAEKRAF